MLFYIYFTMKETVFFCFPLLICANTMSKLALGSIFFFFKVLNAGLGKQQWLVSEEPVPSRG